MVKADKRGSHDVMTVASWSVEANTGNPRVLVVHARKQGVLSRSQMLEDVRRLECAA
jgi:hypothetical protein